MRDRCGGAAGLLLRVLLPLVCLARHGRAEAPQGGLLAGSTSLFDLVGRWRWIFKESAMKVLAKPFVFPPTIHIKEIPLSHFQDPVCKLHGYMHQAERDIVRYVRKYGPEMGILVGNVSADYVLVPHCWGYLLTQELRATKSWTQAKKNLKGYFDAFVGQLRQAGPRALVVNTLMHARYAFQAFQEIPYMISMTGHSHWMKGALPDTYNESKVFVPGCRDLPMTSATGDGPFFYADAWPQDVVIHAPPVPPNDVAHRWYGEAGRDLLFSFMGSNTSCLRVYLKDVWAFDNSSDVYVGNGPPSWATYGRVLQRSRFCLAPDGHLPWSYRFVEALAHGCVPVIVSRSWHPPFHRIFNWGAKDFPVVFVDPGRIPDMRTILESYDDQLWGHMQRLTLPLANLLHPTSVGFFQAVLAELALVKHERTEVRLPKGVVPTAWVPPLDAGAR